MYVYMCVCVCVCVNVSTQMCLKNAEHKYAIILLMPSSVGPSNSSGAGVCKRRLVSSGQKKKIITISTIATKSWVDLAKINASHFFSLVSY